ncbi:MAG: regulatory protein RecX [Clostridia bacterium]|nr:regulatory protein RecX [Clostridia bacterium]MBR3975942.1 regulatory protein RecX [Clostridia bacterium]
MIITTTTAKSGRINIFADGEYKFTVPASVWFSLSYSQEDEISEEELSGLKIRGDSSCAFENALRYLSNRAHSKKELEMKLKRKYCNEAVEYALDKCGELGLIDDEAFARLFAEELSERKKYAPKRIVSELVSRGINREIAENAVNMLDKDVKNSIIDIIGKMCLSANPTEKEKNRVIRRLLNMGYSLSEIRKYIDYGD